MRFLFVFLFLLCSVPFPATSDSHTNILLIVSDDQPLGTVGQYMPNTQREIFDSGVEFTNAFVTTSICCPSRASILTGMYASKHGVHNNRFPLKIPTVVNALHNAGYFTGIVGKYLNSWDGTPRAEFDYWVSFKGGGVTYLDPEINVHGRWQTEKGYITTILGGFAKEFLTRAASQSKPFFLLFTPNAPHDPSTPEERYKSLYADSDLDIAPNFNPPSLSGKPAWLRAMPALNKERKEQISRFRIKQLRALKSLDDVVGELIVLLKQLGKLDETMVIYISDNGVMLGAHRLAEKNYAYEEAVHVPCGVRYPPLISTPRKIDKIAANIDIAPTIYEISGAPKPREVDGLSWLPLFRDSNPAWREEIFFEGWPRDRSAFRAVRSSRYAYIKTEADGFEELYDLAEDPHEMKNLIGVVSLNSIRDEMQRKLSAFGTR